MLSHGDSGILPGSANNNIKNIYCDSLQATLHPPPELIAVVRKIDRKERSRGKYKRHYVVNYHLGRQTEANQDRPISCPHQKSVSIRKPKQRPVYPINRKRDNRYRRTNVKCKKVTPKGEKIDKNRPFRERRKSHLFEEIQASSYKLSDKVRDYNSQSGMLKEDTDIRKKGRKHQNNAYNNYLDICICIIMYISVFARYLVTVACQSKRWRLTATLVLTKIDTLVKIVTKAAAMHEKHHRKYKKDVFNANPDVILRISETSNNFIDVMKRWKLTATPVLTKIYTLVKSRSKSSQMHEKHCDKLHGNVFHTCNCLKICISVENTYFGSWLTNCGSWKPLVTPPCRAIKGALRPAKGQIEPSQSHSMYQHPELSALEPRSLISTDLSSHGQ